MVVSIFRGDTAARQLSFTKATNATLPFSLAGITTLTITANSELNPTDASDELWSVAMITSASLGTATFELDETQADMAPGTYFYDVEALYPTGIRTLVKGNLRVLQDIHKGGDSLTVLQTEDGEPIQDESSQSIEIE